MRDFGSNLEITLGQENDFERWRLEVHDFKAFRHKLGADVLRAFCCCFVHADRLTSLISLAYISLQYHGHESIAFKRNLQTIVWLTVGILRELAISIRDLRSALAKRGLLNPNSAPWIKLREVEDRWEDDPFYREMRNTVAFHVDPDVVEKGLTALEGQRDVVVCEGEGPNQDSSSLRLGLEALSMGFEKNLSDLQKFMARVGEDHGIGRTIQEAFVLALESSGMPIGQAGKRA